MAACPPEDRRQPWNDADFALFITVIPTTTQAHEDADPVKTLSTRYDAWKAEYPSSVNRQAARSAEYPT